MLVSLVYPVADLRSFVADTGRLIRPVWPNPAGEHDFVHSIGMRQERMHEGVKDWVGEGLHINAGRGIRFGESPDPAGPNAIPSPFYSAYRRLFFDSTAVAKFEIGLSDDQDTRAVDHTDELNAAIAPSYADVVTPMPKQYRDVYALQDIIAKHLTVPVRIPNPYDHTVHVSPLGTAASLLARLYAAATTEHKRMLAGAPPKWWVQAGQPLVIVVADRRDTWITLPAHTRTISSPNPEAPELHQHLLRYAGSLRRIWVISHDAHSDGAYSRSLRIHLARLHTEHECLRLVFNSLRSRQLTLESKSKGARSLETYLEHVFTNIAQSEAKQEGELGSDPASWVRESEAAVSVADAQEIMRITQSLRLSAQLKQKIAAYTGDMVTTEEGASYTRNQAIRRRNSLRDAMMEAFSVDELKDVSARLGINEEFIVSVKTTYVNKLIDYADRRGQLEDLAVVCRTLRPLSQKFS